MLPRVLEPEVMDTPEEAVDYDAMDHGEVNRRFVDDWLFAAQRLCGEVDALGLAGEPPRVIDVGTGTALIPIEICRRGVHCRLIAVDLAEEMLKLARRNIASAGYKERIQAERVDAKGLPYELGAFDAVISNSIVHHIPEPAAVFAEMLRVLRTGGLLFLRDLVRPEDDATLENLVEMYAGQENAHQQSMFRASLHAALALEEVRALAVQFGLPPACVEQTTDRHWTLAVRRAEHITRG